MNTGFDVMNTRFDAMKTGFDAMHTGCDARHTGFDARHTGFDATHGVATLGNNLHRPPDCPQNIRLTISFAILAVLFWVDNALFFGFI